MVVVLAPLGAEVDFLFAEDLSDSVVVVLPEGNGGGYGWQCLVHSAGFCDFVQEAVDADTTLVENKLCEVAVVLDDLFDRPKLPDVLQGTYGPNRGYSQ